MSSKTIDLHRSIHDLCIENPDLPQILARLGFTDITKPGMLATAGRFMTIPKGASLKKIDLETIKQEFLHLGYQVIEK